MHVSGRYTDSTVDFSGCTRDLGDNNIANGFNIGFFGGASVIPPGGCVTLDIATFTPVRVERELKEDSFSWRANLSFEPDPDSLIYANVTRGFKGGSFPNLSATEASQYTPVTQEELTAYEAGFKLSRLGGDVQINGAVFYYDYKDKQVRGRIQVPVFGPLEALVNVPDSEILGLEGEIRVRPAEGWNIFLNATYLDSEIGDFQDFDGLGNTGDFTGEAFPNTPALSGSLDISKDWFLANDSRISLGMNLSYQSDTNSNFGELVVFDVDDYALLDLRAGYFSPDDDWNIQLFARNVTGSTYWISANRSVDTIIRVTGQPTIFGVRATVNFP